MSAGQDEYMFEKAQKIREINKNTDLSKEEKKIEIQKLHKIGNHNKQRNEPVRLNMFPTFCDEKKHIFGCQHYQTGAKIMADCCGQLFPCRLCHDEQVKGHQINRHATKTMMCQYCSHIQEVGQNCIKCKRQLSRYYCDICKFHDDDPNKNIYHCHDCGICRIGKGIGIDVFHCKKCNTCLGISLKDSHICIENNLKSNCPICCSDLFSSREGCMLLKCGHAMHKPCFHEFIKSNSFKCPLCAKSIGDLTLSWQRLDRLIASQPMPKEYQKTCQVFCNDCEKKTDSPHHFLGIKCQSCGSYNTSILN